MILNLFLTFMNFGEILNLGENSLLVKKNLIWKKQNVEKKKDGWKEKTKNLLRHEKRRKWKIDISCQL